MKTVPEQEPEWKQEIISRVIDAYGQLHLGRIIEDSSYLADDAVATVTLRAGDVRALQDALKSLPALRTDTQPVGSSRPAEAGGFRRRGVL